MRFCVRDIGVLMHYNLTRPDGHVVTGFSAFEVRVAACAQQWKHKVRPDHPDDVDLALAISILQQRGYDVKRAK